jgi:hypothetical protein
MERFQSPLRQRILQVLVPLLLGIVGSHLAQRFDENPKVYGPMILIAVLLPLVLLILWPYVRAPQLKWWIREIGHYLTSLWTRPSWTLLERELQVRTLSDGHAEYYYLETTDRHAMETLLSERARLWRKPIIFAKFKAKDFLCWIEAADLFLLRDLSRCGFRPVVYLQDSVYNCNGQTGEITVEPYPTATVQDFRRCIRYIVGLRCKILPGKKTFEKYKYARELYSFFTDRVLPSIPRESQRTRDTSRGLVYRLLAYPGVLVAEILGRRRILAVVQWEELKTKWRSRLVTDQPFYLPLILGRSVRLNGEKLPTDEEGDSLNLTDPLERFFEKINSPPQGHRSLVGHKQVLEMLCRLMLFLGRPFEYHWDKYLHTLTDRASLEPVVKELLGDKDLADDIRGSLQKVLDPQVEFSESFKSELAKLANLDLAFLKLRVVNGYKQLRNDYPLPIRKV